MLLNGIKLEATSRPVGINSIGINAPEKKAIKACLKHCSPHVDVV